MRLHLSPLILSTRRQEILVGKLAFRYRADRQERRQQHVNQSNNEFASWAAVQNETDNFTHGDQSKHARTRACWKRSLEDLSVPDMGRE